MAVGAFLFLTCVSESETVEPGRETTSTPVRSEYRGATEGITGLKTSSVGLSGGQSVYVPIYSHVYHHDRTRTFNLTATLSVRNTDSESAIHLDSVRYYDTEGELVESFLDGVLSLPPLASVDYVVEERDVRGGSGANFIVEWSAEGPVTAPVIEAVMVSTKSSQGISFRSPGRVLAEKDFLTEP